VNSEVFRASPAEALVLAQRHINLESSPTERPLVPKHVKQLMNKLLQRRWLPCSWATVLYEGTLYRMNGQHSSYAITQCPLFLPDPTVIHLDHFEANDPDGMALLFRQFDARWSARSKQDEAGAYQGLVKEIRDLDRVKCKIGIEAARYFDYDIQGTIDTSEEDVYTLFFKPKYHSFLIWLDGMLSSRTREVNRNKGVIAAMFGTFGKSRSGADEFWPAALGQDLCDDTDPRFVLGRELGDYFMKKLTPMPSTLDFYIKSAKAWNAWRAGQPINNLQVKSGKGKPILAS
jgi:hypothetical protein